MSEVDEIELPDPAEILAEDSETEEKVQDSKETVKEPEEKDVQKEEEKTETEEEPVKTDEPEVKEPEAEADEPERVDVAEQARRGYAERRQLKDKVAKSLESNPEYTPQSADELKSDGMDPALAEIEALRQEVRRDQIINELTDLNSQVNTDANTVLRDFPVFDPQSKSYDEKFAKGTEDLYRRVSNFQMDSTNSYVTRSDMSLYDFFSFAANARNSGKTSGVVEGQKAADQMLSASEDASSAESVEDKPEDDDFLAGLKGERGIYSKK